METDRTEIFTPRLSIDRNYMVSTEIDRKLTGLKFKRPVYRLIEIYSDLRKITNYTN